MHMKRKWIYGIVGFVVFLVLFNFGINSWLRSKLPEIFEKNTNYEFKFEELSISVFKSSLSVEGINIRPKKGFFEEKPNYVTADIGHIRINGINFFKLITNKDISISSVEISRPDMVFYKSSEKNKDTIRAQSQVNNSININKLKITGGAFQIKEKETISTSDKTVNQYLLKVDHIDFALEEIVFSPDTFSDKIPFTYKKIELNIKALDYNLSDVYSIRTKSVSLTTKSFSLDSLEFRPKMLRNHFVSQLRTEKDLYNISAQNIIVKDLDWGFVDEDLFVKTPLVEINTVDASIFRSKVPADDTSKKLLYSALLRELPFFMEIEKVALKNSRIVYEEEIIRKQAGKLTFSEFKADILNVNSGYKKTELPDVVIDIDCLFMYESELKVRWDFNPMDKTEQFHIKGNIFNYDLNKTTPFLKPRMHVSAEGRAREIAFNFAGNDIIGTGNFMINYDSLKVTFYKKNLRGKNHFKGILANVLVKSSSKGEQKEVEIQPVYRKQDRSFFNFFWSCILQGLEQTIIVI